ERARGQQLERHVALEVRVVRAIDDAHAALAHLLEHPVPGERPAFHDGIHRPESTASHASAIGKTVGHGREDLEIQLVLEEVGPSAELRPRRAAAWPETRTA